MKGSHDMRVAIMVAALMAAAAPHAAVAQQPYAGQQERDIKALSAEEIADLRAGRGMGMAKAAELNHYPGPVHILQLGEQLALSPAQTQAAQAALARMSAAAEPLGLAVLARERQLDQAFAAGTITPEELARETAAIGELQGRLRAVHLGAHLEMRQLLTPVQIARYDALRGYADTTSEHPAALHHDHGG
jgi:hypothetical protein